MKISRAELRLSRVTQPVIGDADPDVVEGNCVSCGQYGELNRGGQCVGDPVCRRHRAQRALDSGAAIIVNGTVYIIAEKLHDASQAQLSPRKTASNAQRQAELGDVVELTQRDFKRLRHNLTHEQIRLLEAQAETEDVVPECTYDGCRDCPRAGDTLCVKHRIEANAVRHRLNPPNYRRSESTSTELPSRRRSRGNQRMGKIRGMEKLRNK